MKARTRISIAVFGAVALHAGLAMFLLNRFQTVDVEIPQESIEILAEDSAPPAQSTAPEPEKAAAHVEQLESHLVQAAPHTAGVKPEHEQHAPSSGPKVSKTAVGSYLGNVRDRLSAAIRVPRIVLQPRRLILKLTLLESGDVKDPSIDRSSGYPEIDRLVLEALERAKPFPAFTKELAGMHELTLRIPIVIRSHR